MGRKKKYPEEIALERKRHEEFKDEIQARRAKLESQENERAVVLLSHIPHGFYETQMLDYFSQFGEVTRLRLVRSKKTGKSRQFAFIEFRFQAVAKIVAQTMNNYLMYQKILKCKLIPREEIRPSMFKNWKYKYHVPRTRRQAIKRHNEEQTDPEKIERKKRKVITKRKALQKKLNELGIEYDIFNVKCNESFVPSKRPRASKEDMEKLRAAIPEIDERCSDFEYSDDEVLKEDEEPLSPEGDRIDKDEANMLKRKTPKRYYGKSAEEREDFGVMVVDPEDTEITFKSPPAEAKIKRKSLQNYLVADENEKAIVSSGRSIPASSKKRRLLKLKQLQIELDNSEE